MKRRRVTIKIGSNVLARPDGTLDVTRMSALMDQICQLRRSDIDVILVSSGAVACGRSELTGIDASRLDNVSARQLYSAVGQVKLINRYYDLAKDLGMNIGQILTMKENFSTRHHYLNQRCCMETMLQHGIMPVVNENDTVSVTELMFTDNDELSGLIAAMTDCDTLIILSNIDGVYTGNPSDPGSHLIESVLPDSDLSQYISPQRSGFGRGGMVTKYNIARKVSSEGINVIIANGKRDGILTGLLLHPEHTPCTRFVAAPSATSSLKRWIAHSEGFAKGVVHISDKAAKAITAEGAASLLPVGVTAVDGDFERDDIVTIVGPDGATIGLGRSGYDADEARACMGQRGRRPLVHYDYLYIE